MRGWRTASEAETRQLGSRVALELLPDRILLLSGDLGTGKTVLVQGVAEGLGLASTEVQSPSFTIIREHEGSLARLIHVDLYRLRPEEIPALALEEVFAEPAVKAVEWAERLPFPVADAVRLVLFRSGSGQREIREVPDFWTPVSSGAVGEWDRRSQEED